MRAAGISLAFGSRPVFQGLELVIEESERVGLIGVNGSGKSTLMRILAGAQPPDAGELQAKRGARITVLPQEPAFEPGATVESEMLAGGAEPHEGRALVDRLGVKDWDRPVSELSGGGRKRVAIARALLSRPDLLMLDEPTNHLDADTVDWLEEELDRLQGALLLVTHDRYFLDDLVDRIVEIQPGAGLASYPGNYQAYLEERAAREDEAGRQQHKRERRIAQEVAWLRQGVEARRTKSKARIERAQRLMAEKGLQRAKTAALKTAAAPRLRDHGLEARGVSKSFGERRVIEDVSIIVQRGERIGIVGRNGAGKTTFLRLLLGELQPDAGEVVTGKNTRIAYYDQQRAQLDPEWTVYEAALGERIHDGDVRRRDDFIELGERRVALRDYLEELLFPVPMQNMQVKALWGGERNRLLLARLFLQGANLLVLDEPTNDLDLVTLNVLEQLLLEFTGSVLLVTHDRYFLDKVATSIFAFDRGRAVRYPGNYEMFLSLRPPTQRTAPSSAKAQVERKPSPRKPGKLSFKEQRDLESIEAQIEAAESRKAQAEAALGDVQTYAKEPQRVPELQRQLDESAAEIERLYARWQELQDLQGPAS